MALPAVAYWMNCIPCERLRVRRNDQARANRQMTGDPCEVIGPQRNAAFRRATDSSPPMHEDRRAHSWHCIRPVPIRQQHEVVESVRTPKPLVGCSKGCPYHFIVGGVSGIIAPAVIRMDHSGPRCRSRNPVGTVEHPYNLMDARRRAAISFTLFLDYATAANGAGKSPLSEPKPGWGKNHVGRQAVSSAPRHPVEAVSIRTECRRLGWFVHRICPDLLALTSR